MIEIPGYRLVRPLGRGGMATVYLALQESVQREVALKVMSPTLLGDPQFGERFLREARIAAKLKHPHVVQVHDVGQVGDYHYIAMEYLPGGPVLTRNGAPRELPFALRVTREIAGALGYAGTRGIVHRDIKPDNILLREDGAAVLTDFGIARASDASRMTRTGAIIGTPHYMSPEQARGQPLDGRADLYSLGIVFHELLVGRVPYQADDSLAVGIMHITAPLPRLPAALAMLQPILDRLLAKEPDQRFQDGHALAQALAAVEREVNGVTRPMVVPMSPPPPPPPPPPARAVRQEPATVPIAALPRDDARAEPQLGLIDEVLRDPRPRGRRRGPDPAPARPRRGNRLGWIAAVLIVLGVGVGAAWRWQDTLRGWLPQTRQNELLARADRALLESRLTQADGQGARELYAAALAQDPDSQPARVGLQQVGQRLLEAARTALAHGDLAAARAALAQARELSVPAAEADALQQRIDARVSQGFELEALLQRARDALAAGRLDTPEDGAIALFRRALAAEPGNTLATVGLRDALTAQLERARALVEAGQLAAAQGQVEAVAAVDPGHLGLPDARARLAEARTGRENELGVRLEAADQALRAGRLTAPAADSARQRYREVLRADPGNARAQEGLRRIASALIAQAQRLAADYEFERAAALLDEAQATAPDVPGLATARSRLREQERKRAQSVPPVPDAAQLQPRIAQLLEEARVAAEAGNLLAPPGDSAYDKYRAVRALQPDNAAARAGLAALPGHARRRFEEALGANRLASARGALEALATFTPGDATLPEMRRRLARSLLGQAAERLGAGELRRANEFFDQAREIDPTNPELPSMQARLEQAGGG